MITGYNTDIKHQEVVFHVQTEDKGLQNPFIESLVYVGGQVVASKRAGYAEMLATGKGEKDIVGMMDHQHRVMIAAIKSGKFDDRVPQLLQSRAVPERRETATHAVAVAAGADSERSLDQVILDYLATEAQHDQLALEMDSANSLQPGGRNDLVLLATASKSGRPVPGAQVTVKMISTVAHPRTLASGETDGQGRLALALEIPRIEQGVAALIITASSPIGAAEIKHLL
ncbi:MAG: hypothetical protein ACM3OB_04020 [Acidobacteriota bacterium]